MLDLYDLEYPALEALLRTWGESPVHARELWRWLYRELPTAPEPPETLPQAVRQRLRAETRLAPLPAVLARQEAGDGSRKDLLALEDGERVEVVLLRYRRRYSACISTQVGCACGCTFCATGQQGFTRNLSSGEIVAQVLHVRRELAAQGAALNNFVLMGMGEPLLNYAATLAALRQLTDPRGAGFVPRRITLSTVGIPEGIQRLAEEPLAVNLALSLHAATDDFRTRLVPLNARYPLAVLREAVQTYTARTGRRIMIEWTLMDGLNDTPEQAAALIAWLRGIPAHVNLIRLNPTASCPERPAALEALDAFAAALDRAGIPHTVRQRKGQEIAAGCGQLRAREGDLS